MLSEGEGAVVDGIDVGEGLQVQPFFFQDSSAILKALFDDDADADAMRFPLGDDVEQPEHRLSVGEEVVDDEDAFACVYELFGYFDGVGFVFGVGIYFTRVGIKILHFRFDFLGEHHRNVEILGGDHRDRDARCFDGQDLVDLDIGEAPFELLPHFVDQFDVELMVDEAVHFDDVPGKDFAVFQDALLELFHVYVRKSMRISCR
jgi:hypothetical protein